MYSRSLVVAIFSLLVLLLVPSTHASPPPRRSILSCRGPQPVFPATPASCPICAQNFAGINSCALAAPVLANFTSVLFNPGAFINVIRCACTDTFQAVFPQCVDCFEKTNQTDVLNTPDLPAVVTGVRNVCASASAILSNASSTGAPSPTTSTSAGFRAAAVSAGGLRLLAAAVGAVAIGTLLL